MKRHSDASEAVVPSGEYGVAAAAAGISSAVCFGLYPFVELTNLVMVYLIGTVLVSLRGHRGPAAFSSLLSVLCFDFFFVPPRFRFSVSDAQYLLTFGVMFASAMTISHLVIRLREKAQAAQESERRAVWLLEKAKKAEIEAESEHLRSALLSSVSHDLRTPLAAILGSAGTLLARGGSLQQAQSRELLENIQAESERLSRLIQNLLEATRLESSPVQLKKERYPLEEVVGAALGRLESLLGRRQVEVRIPGELPAIPMDGVLMEQVFINLLENAARYTGPNGRLEISAEVRDDAVVTTLSDDGPGLKPDEVERVFDKFYKGESSKGSGLGLAICRAIVQAHGGRIWAENRVPAGAGLAGGAVFGFTLPLGPSDGR